MFAGFFNALILRAPGLIFISRPPGIQVFYGWARRRFEKDIFFKIAG
jgi:hypothetical protein